MTCAESQDLLLDLAYGELDRTRAAEVESHVAGCAACRAEKTQIDETRKLVAPLRELEEPSERFDEPLLRAARAEAGMQADGTPGPVVEVTGSVKPLGLSAARVDPHAQVLPTKASPPRPRWTRRAAVFAAVAAAAGLAVVVTSSLSTKVQRGEEVDAIRVRVPAAVQSSGEAISPAPAPEKQLRDGFEGSGGGESAKRGAAGAVVGGAVAEATKKAAPPSRGTPRPQKRKAPEERKLSDQAVSAGPLERVSQPPEKTAKSDVPPTKEHEVVAEPAAPAASVVQAPAAQVPPAAVTRRSAPPPATQETRTQPQDRPSQPARDRAEGVAAAKLPAVVGGPMAAREPQLAADAERRDAPDLLEDQAGSARRRGAYARAAELYRSASTLRKQAGDDARAAWDLAHAVECLAAGSQVPEAISLRDELRRSFPDQRGPQSAANSALRYAAPATAGPPVK